MSWNIAGRTVLITGAARGIGAETTVRLHERGARIGLEFDLMEQLSARLGDRATAFEADVTDADAVQSAVDGALRRARGRVRRSTYPSPSFGRRAQGSKHWAPST